MLGFLKLFDGEHSRTELMSLLNLKDIKNFKKNYLKIALDENYVELTIPEKPNSNLQKYRLTEKGMFIVNKLK